jgi:hypothetical protein
LRRELIPPICGWLRLVIWRALQDLHESRMQTGHSVFCRSGGLYSLLRVLVVSRARHRLHRLPFFGGGRAGGSPLPRSTLRLFVLTMWTPAHAAQVHRCVSVMGKGSGLCIQGPRWQRRMPSAIKARVAACPSATRQSQECYPVAAHQAHVARGRVIHASCNACIGHRGLQVGAATLRNRRPTSNARSPLSAWNVILGAA